MQEYLSVGKITNTHGIKGELKVIPSTSDVSRFEYLYNVTIDLSPKAVGKGDAQSPDAKSLLKKYAVENVRYHQTYVLMTLHGIDNMNDAETLKGRELWIPREEARELDDDEWFICDLIGLEVYEENKLLGKLTEVIETGSNDVYVVTDNAPGKKEILIPALKDVILIVDIEKRMMAVKLPDGLLDDATQDED